MAVITTSVFELLKIGPGPSSSHTIGPMKAGFDFFQMMKSVPKEKMAAASSLQVFLYGSLAATGKGHGTDRAILAGLLGKSPEDCPPDFLDTLVLERGTVMSLPAGDRTIPFRSSDMYFDAGRFDFPFSNTMIIRLSSIEGAILEREYYSVGGGFLQWKGWQESERGAPRYPYENAEQLWKRLKKHRLKLDELMMANEKAITGLDETEINRRLDRIIGVMEESVQRGVRTEGFLPGPIGLHRKAALFYQRAKSMPVNAERLLVYLFAYAFAAAEENAGGHIVVTAPTCGSAGVVPAVVALLRHHYKLPLEVVRRALLASVAIGFIAKQNASISGAEVGCQGEIGVASALAAALLAFAHDSGGVRIAENAAETALEHHLGMTCDPVKGYVQIPCIERNAMGAVKAYTSWLIAREGLPDWHIVGFDKAVEAMNLTGRDMRVEYRETSLGGLARCC
ncbi:MAG: L-serine ammonia-lyase [Syntrophobacteraceae bacterium]